MANYSDILLTVDFDRTLTAPDSTIPQRNLDAIRDFMARGGAFTVNTGRSVPMFRKLRERIPANVPYLLYNGSAAWDGGELLLQRPIQLDQETVIRDLLEKFPDLNLEIQGVDRHYNFVESPGWNRFCDQNGCARATVDPGADLGPFLKFSLCGEIREGTVAELFTGTPEEMARILECRSYIEKTYGQWVVCFLAAPRILDVHAKGVSKLASARALQARLGRKILVCVGDAENDITMLDGADYAFCPADGVVADRYETVCPCGEGAVADVIEKKIPEILKNRT